MVRAIVACVALLACSSEKPAGKKKKIDAPIVTLAAGPVPVTLVTVEGRIVHTLSTAKEFVVIDAHGGLTFGDVTAGAKPFVGDVVERLPDSDRGFDGFGVLSRDTTTAIAVIVADAASPARVVVRDGIRAYPWKPTFLAVNHANTVVPYRFGEDAWDEPTAPRVRVDDPVFPGEPSPSLVVEFTDTTTAAKLVAVLATAADRGVKRVRLHRMMGWGDVPPVPVALHGVADDDDVFSDDPATVTVGDPRIEGTITPDAIRTMLANNTIRLRYCFEARVPRVKSGTLELAFDIDKLGNTNNVTAKGLDEAVASCIAGALPDMLVPRNGIETPGHAVVSLAFMRASDEKAAAETAEKQRLEKEKGTGWWCWAGEDSFGPVGRCARLEDECNAVLAGYSQTMTNLGNSEVKAECKHQTTAWESASTAPQATKALCRKLAEKGESCRAVR